MTTISTPAGETNYSITYSAGQRQASIDSSDDYTRTLTFDGLGRVQEEHMQVANYSGSLRSFHTDFSYDLLGRVTEVLYPARHYMQARWYDPGAGRFLSIDPHFDIRSPQTQNPYSYAANNPLKFTDPMGMDIWDTADETITVTGSRGDGGGGGGGGGAGMGAFSQSGTAMAGSLGGLGSVTVTPFDAIGVSPFIPASESDSGSESEGDSTSEDGGSEDAPIQLASIPPPAPIAPPSRPPTPKEISRELKLQIMIEATDALEDDWDGNDWDKSIFGPAVPPGYQSPG